MKKIILIIFIFMLTTTTFLGDSNERTLSQKEILFQNKIHTYKIEGYTFYTRGYCNILEDERWNLGYVEMDSVIAWYNETIDRIKVHADSLQHIKHPFKK